MKRSLRILSFAAIVCHLIGLQATGALRSQNPSQNPPSGSGSCPTCCPSCNLGLPDTVTFEWPVSLFERNPDLRRLRIDASTLGGAKVGSVKIEIVSPSGQILFRVDDVSAKVVESKVLIDIPDKSAKAALRYLNPANKLRITVKTVGAPPDKGRA